MSARTENAYSIGDPPDTTKSSSNDEKLTTRVARLAIVGRLRVTQGQIDWRKVQRESERASVYENENSASRILFNPNAFAQPFNAGKREYRHAGYEDQGMNPERGRRISPSDGFRRGKSANDCANSNQ
jgi:hypothetical protein